MIGFIFCHGWGLDKDFWQNILPYFKDYPCIFWDLGYFNKPLIKIPSNLNSTKWIGVGHSLGFIKLLESNIDFKAIIGLQAFTNFLGTTLAIKERRSRLLNHMINNITVEPISTLRNFYHEANISFSANLTEKINIKNLSSDLIGLSKDNSSLLTNISCLIIASSRDKIVPPSIIEDNFNFPNCHVIMHDNSSHDLGYSKPNFISEKIIEFITTQHLSGLC